MRKNIGNLENTTVNIELLKKNLQEEFTVEKAIESIESERLYKDYPNELVNDLIISELNKNLKNYHNEIKLSDDDWIEIDPTDPLLENVTGGGANVNITINVNAMLTVNAAIYLNVGAAIYAVVAVLVAVAGNQQGFCCFPKGTWVKKSDGTKAYIENLVEGTEIIGSDKSINKVLERIECVAKAGEMVFCLNNEVECTSEQLFLSEEKKWLAINLKGYQLYRSIKRIINPQFGIDDRDLKQMSIGDRILSMEGSTVVSSIEERIVTKDEILYSFKLDGDGSFNANKYIVNGK